MKDMRNVNHELKEYAILEDGEVVSIFLTSRLMDAQARRRYIGEVLPVEEVPVAKLEAYRHWMRP